MINSIALRLVFERAIQIQFYPPVGISIIINMAYPQGPWFKTAVKPHRILGDIMQGKLKKKKKGHCRFRSAFELVIWEKQYWLREPKNLWLFPPKKKGKNITSHDSVKHFFFKEWQQSALYYFGNYSGCGTSLPPKPTHLKVWSPRWLLGVVESLETGPLSLAVWTLKVMNPKAAMKLWL